MLNTHLDRRPLLRSTRVVTVLLLVTLTVPIAAMAGQRFSKFTGTVLDQTNGLVPNMTLSLTNKDSQARYEVRTDRTGRFEFLGLPDGEYALDVLATVFTPLTESVTIAGRDLNRNIQLQMTVEETITIIGGGSDRPSAAQHEEAQQSRQTVREMRQRAAARCSGGGAGTMHNFLLPTKITDVKPQYPEGLAIARFGGVVSMEAVIGTDGTTREVRVLHLADPDLERAAVEAVRQWEFTPSILNCTPVDTRVHVTVNFVAQP